MTAEEFQNQPPHKQEEFLQRPDCPVKYKREYLGEYEDDEKENAPR